MNILGWYEISTLDNWNVHDFAIFHSNYDKIHHTSCWFTQILPWTIQYSICFLWSIYSCVHTHCTMLAHLSSTISLVLKQIVNNREDEIYKTIWAFMSVGPYSGSGHVPSNFQWLQLYHKISQLKVAWHVFRMKNVYSGSPSDPLSPKGEEKPSYIITLLSKVKLWNVYQNSLHCFITSPT